MGAAWQAWKPWRDDIKENPWNKKPVVPPSRNDADSQTSDDSDVRKPEQMSEKEWATIDHLELTASHRSYYEQGGKHGTKH